MAIQKGDDLTNSLDEKNAPVLEWSDLTPEFSQLAMNLIIDSKRTLQSEMNKKLFWSFKTWSLMLSCVLVYVLVRMQGLLKYKSFNLLLHSENFMYQVLYMTIACFMIVSIVFASVGELTRFLKEELDSIPENTAEVFGFDLKEFAGLPETEADVEYAIEKSSTTKGKGVKKEQLALVKEYREILKQGQNTKLVVYRTVPILVITFSKDNELTRDDQYVVRIRGLAVRRVYNSVGLQNDLIQWVYFKAREMYIEDGYLNKDIPLRIFFDVYSFESHMISILKSLPGWQLVTSVPANPNFLVDKFFGITKQTWAVGMNIEAKK